MQSSLENKMAAAAEKKTHKGSRGKKGGKRYDIQQILTRHDRQPTMRLISIYQELNKDFKMFK